MRVLHAPNEGVAEEGEMMPTGFDDSFSLEDAQGEYVEWTSCGPFELVFPVACNMGEKPIHTEGSLT